MEGPSEYMSRLLLEVLAPAAEAVAMGAGAGAGRLLGDVVSGVVGALLAHLLETGARISCNGARQLQQARPSQRPSHPGPSD